MLSLRVLPPIHPRPRCIVAPHPRPDSPIPATTITITIGRLIVTEGVNKCDRSPGSLLRSYQTPNVRRFGEWVLGTTPPDPAVTTRLDVDLHG